MATHVVHPCPNCEHEFRIPHAVGRTGRLLEIRSDAKSAAYAGEFSFTWESPADRDDYLLFRFSDPNAALAFKMRWA